MFIYDNLNSGRVKLAGSKSAVSNTPLRQNIFDLSPGKLDLSDREIQKLALQGIFDYPNNKINSQLLDNIDIKEAKDI